MNPLLSLVAAGTAFASTVIAGLALGAWLDSRTHAGYWTLLLFFIGIALGGYGAWRLVSRALRT